LHIPNPDKPEKKKIHLEAHQWAQKKTKSRNFT